MSRYIGMRYTPFLDGEWNNTKEYENLTIVTHNGLSYTSRCYVPCGIDIENTTYWLCTGDFNGFKTSMDNTIRKQLIDKMNELVVYVENFGVIGDGITDDLPALQSAINYGALNNLPVVIPEYLTVGISKCIVIPSNLHLIMNGIIQPIENANINTSMEFFDRVTETPEYSGVHDVIIEGNGTFNLRGNEFQNWGGALRIHHCNNILIKDITIKNVEKYHIAEIGGSRNVTFDNVKCLSVFMREEYTNYNNDPEYIQYEHSIEKGTAGAIPYDNTPCKNLHFKNCYFGKSEEGGFFYKAIANHSGYNSNLQPHKNIVIENCTFENADPCSKIPSTGGAISLGHQTDNVIIRNNLFKNINTSAITIYLKKDVKNVVIQNNKFENVIGSGIHCATKGEVFSPIKNLSINNNIFYECGIGDDIAQNTTLLYSPILLFNSENAVIENNTIYNYGMYQNRPIHIENTYKETNINTIIRNNNFFTAKEYSVKNFKRINDSEDVLIEDGMYYYGEYDVERNPLYYEKIGVYYSVKKQNPKYIELTRDMINNGYCITDYNMTDNTSSSTFSLELGEILIQLTTTKFKIVNNALYNVLTQKACNKTDNIDPGSKLHLAIRKVVGIIETNNKCFVLNTNEVV